MMEIWGKMDGSLRQFMVRLVFIRRSRTSTSETVTPRYVRSTVMRLLATVWWCRLAENFPTMVGQ